MNPKLPRKLTRKDFDSDEEFAEYLATEQSDWQPVEDIDDLKEHWKRIASNTINGKRSRISIAIPDRNLARLKAQALRQGIPYQTLINEVLHEHLRKSHH